MMMPFPIRGQGGPITSPTAVVLREAVRWQSMAERRLGPELRVEAPLGPKPAAARPPGVGQVLDIWT